MAPAPLGLPLPTSLSASGAAIHPLPAQPLTSCLPFQVFSLVAQTSGAQFCLQPMDKMSQERSVPFRVQIRHHMHRSATGTNPAQTTFYGESICVLAWKWEFLGMTNGRGALPRPHRGGPPEQAMSACGRFLSASA